jgi:hypothetical protein
MMIALKVSVFMNKTRSFEFSSENNFFKIEKTIKTSAKV